MKTTMDLPDDLYRRVKAKSALQGRAVREVTIELYQRWLSEAPGRAAAQAAPEWLSEWLDRADAYVAEAPKGPTAREILDEDRNRAEPR